MPGPLRGTRPTYVVMTYVGRVPRSGPGMKPAANAAAATVATGWNAEATRTSHRLSDFITLAKPRLNLLVLVTTAAGLYLAAPEGLPTAVLVHTLVGTALVAGGAAALNQVWERESDALMRRTRTRPLPGGRLRAAEGAW